MVIRESFEHSIWNLLVGFTFIADQGRVALTRGGLGSSPWVHSFAAGLTLRAGGFPQVFVLFAWGGNEGTHTIASINTSETNNDLRLIAIPPGWFDSVIAGKCSDAAALPSSDVDQSVQTLDTNVWIQKRVLVSRLIQRRWVPHAECLTATAARMPETAAIECGALHIRTNTELFFMSVQRTAMAPIRARPGLFRATDASAVIARNDGLLTPVR